jgi:hypothetical protein
VVSYNIGSPAGLNIMKKTLFVCVAAAFLVSVLPVHAQSPLADAARREAARRKAVSATSIPMYTGEDLSRLPPRMAPPMPKPATTEVITLGPAGSQTAAAQTGAAAPAGQPAAAAPGPRDEKYWRDRIGAVRTNLARAEIFAESLQSRINSLSADIVNRDDPAQRQKLMEQRQAALDEFDRVKKEIVGFLQQLADIEDEARRLNVPAGWVR